MRKLLLLMSIVLWAVPGFALVSPDLQGVMTRARATDLISVNIVFKDQMDPGLLTSMVKSLPKPERRAMVAKILTDYSTERQAEVMAYLRVMEKQGQATELKSFWIHNGIHCRTTVAVISAIEQRSDVYYVDYDLKPLKLERGNHTPVLPDREIAWGVRKINAPAVWSLGYTGQGVVVGIVDTGVNHNHLDLHDHIWTDANYPNHGWDFEFNDNDPMDESGHGSHCAGSVSSDGTAGSQCGVAPDAQMLCCKVRTVADSVAEWQVFAAWQFCISPPLSPTHGADAMTMSLGWLISWNPHQSTWRTNANTVGAAGIIQCVAAGNESGITPPNSCRCPGNVPSPWRHPANGATGAQSNIISIGATDSLDNIGSFSSLGPVTWQSIAPFNDYVYPPGLTKPDVSAPGVYIKSLNYASNNGYVDGWDGTSMATPHAAGTVALMLQKNPYLTQVQADSILQVTAVDLGAAGKDNTFGSGRINALAAVNATPSPGAPVTPTVISPLDYARLPTLTPTLRFTSTDPQGDPIIYRVYWDTDTAFSTPDSAVTGSFASGTIAQFVFPSALTTGETYWWRVRARDTTSSGMWSSTTGRRSFTVDPAGLPANTCSWFQTQGDQFVNCVFSATRIQGDSVTLVPVGYIQDTLLFQNFETGSMPAGWTVVNGNGDPYQWTVGTTGDIGGYAPPSYGSYYAYYSDDDAGSGVINNNEELISPKIYVPAAAANLSVIYGWGFQLYQTGEKYRVKFRKKVGAGAWTAWTDIMVYTTSGSGTQTISLSAQLPCDSVQFDWFYSDSTASSHWGYANATDNVLLAYDYTYQNNSGTLTGPGVVYNTLSTTYPRSFWGDAVWRKAAATDSIGMQVEYYNGSTWQLVPNSLIPGNSSGKFSHIAADTVRLNLVADTVTYNTLRLKGLFYRITKAPGDPALLDWEVGNLSKYIGVAEQTAGGSGKMMLGVYPNPSHGKIAIEFQIPNVKNQMNAQSPNALKIFDAAGRLVKSFSLPTSVEWNGTDDLGRRVPAGVYFVRLETENAKLTEKAILLR